MSNIEWTDETWNPVIGCTPVSAGCLNCYAATMARRLEAMGKPEYAPKHHEAQMGTPYDSYTPAKTVRVAEKRGGRAVFTGDVRLLPDKLTVPLKWRKPRKVFVNSMSDLFHEAVPFDFIDRVIDIAWDCPQHTFQVLTKRVDRLVEYVKQRGYNRTFGWTPQERTPFRIGEYIHLDDMYGRNQCGWAGGGCWQCNHPKNDESGKEDSCHTYQCPIASIADTPEDLKNMGLEDQYVINKEGFVDDMEWMKLHSRPRHALPGNIWLGFSAEDQKSYETRARQFRVLRDLLGPHYTFFVSMEPLIGPIDLKIQYYAGEGNLREWSILDHHKWSGASEPRSTPYVNQVIVGGESGPGARPCDVQWIRDIVRQCKAAGVPVFVKQLGANVFAPWATHWVEATSEGLPCRKLLNSRNKTLATVWHNGVWHTLDADGVGGENGAESYLHDAQNAALAALVRQHLRPYKGWKQHASTLRDPKGGDMAEWPEDLRVREWPGGAQ